MECGRALDEPFFRDADIDSVMWVSLLVFAGRGFLELLESLASLPVIKLFDIFRGCGTLLGS